MSWPEAFAVAAFMAFMAAVLLCAAAILIAILRRER